MRDRYCLGQVERWYGDAGISDVNRRVLLRFDGELVAEGVKPATRCSYAMFLVRLARWLGSRSFRDVDKETLYEFFMSVKGELKDSSFNLMKSKLKRFFKWLHTGSLYGREFPEVVKWFTTKIADGDDLPVSAEDIIYEYSSRLHSCLAVVFVIIRE